MIYNVYGIKPDGHHESDLGNAIRCAVAAVEKKLHTLANLESVNLRAVNAYRYAFRDAVMVELIADVKFKESMEKESIVKIVGSTLKTYAILVD